MAILKQAQRLAPLVYRWVMVGFILCIHNTATIAETADPEYQLEAAYLFHFLELTKWPNNEPNSICLLGSSPLRTTLPALEGKVAQNQAVHVNLDKKLEITTCNLLFLSETALLSETIKQQAVSHSILLVSDSPGFTERGGMIQLTLKNNKLRLIVNLNTLNAAGLKLNSNLLRMADILE